MNLIAILSDDEFFFKKEPLILLSEVLKKQNITFVWPENEKDLLNVWKIIQIYEALFLTGISIVLNYVKKLINIMS